MSQRVGSQKGNVPFSPKKNTPVVYIIANQRNGTIYIRVTSALWNRIAAHKSKSLPGFSSKYGIANLVWYEHHQTMEAAIHREKQLRKWNRNWKLYLIEKMNPNWRGLHEEIDYVDTIVEPKSFRLTCIISTISLTESLDSLGSRHKRDTTHSRCRTCVVNLRNPDFH